jgi:spore coat polysaccharide biosynthesis protein SpsF
MTTGSRQISVMGIVQARMGATRLPGKMLRELRGHPIIHWILSRCKTSQLLDHLTVAIPTGSSDDILADYVKSADVPVFRGSEHDVLSRFYNAVKPFQPDWVVRICADNPFISGSQIDHLIRFAGQTDVDYAYNHIPRGNVYPDGLGAEIVKFDILERIFYEAQRAEQREHIFNYIWDNQDQFIISTFNPSDDYLARPSIRLDVDQEEDLIRLNQMVVTPGSTDREIIAAAGAL